MKQKFNRIYEITSIFLIISLIISFAQLIFYFCGIVPLNHARASGIGLIYDKENIERVKSITRLACFASGVGLIFLSIYYINNKGVKIISLVVALGIIITNIRFVFLTATYLPAWSSNYSDDFDINEYNLIFSAQSAIVSFVVTMILLFALNVVEFVFSLVKKEKQSVE